MENKLLVEINQIRSNMGLSVISENTQIILEASSSATLEAIFTSLFSRTSRSILKTALTIEEKELVRKYLKNEIKDNTDKLKFSNFMKTSQGALTVQELKAGVITATTRTNNPIDDLSAAYYNKLISKMEKTKTEWGKSLPKTESIVGKVVKIKNVLTSYFKDTTKIENKIRDDIASYKYLTNKAKSMVIGPEQTLALKDASRYLDRVELNLGILKRKSKETINTMLTQLKIDVRTLPKNSPEKIGIQNLITKMESPNATIENIWKYLPSNYKPENTWVEEVMRLKKERGDRLQGMFGNKIPGWLISKKEGYKNSLGGFFKNTVHTVSGNIAPMFSKIFSNPKLIPRILTTEIGSRLISLPLSLAIIETAYDAILFSTLQNELNIKKYPRISKVISATNPDYKNYDNTNWGTDILVDFLTNWFENVGLTIPVKVIIDWMDTNFKSGGLSNWFENERNLLKNIVNDGNLSLDEKKKKINEIIEKNKSFIEKTFSFFLGQNEETLTNQINKELSGINLSDTTPSPQPEPVGEVYTNDPEGFKKYIKLKFPEEENPVIAGTKDKFYFNDIEFKYENGKFK